MSESLAGYSLKQLGSDPEPLRALLHNFLRDTDDAAERLASQVESNALAQLAAAVHYIRGAALYMDAIHLSEVGRRLERAARQADQELSRRLLPQFLACLEPLRAFLRSQLAQLDPTQPSDSCCKR